MKRAVRSEVALQGERRPLEGSDRLLRRSKMFIDQDTMSILGAVRRGGMTLDENLPS